jgi:uncharacterized protein YciI
MKYFAAIAPVKDKEKSQRYRPEHLAFLKEQTERGHVLMNGKFADGTGGLVIYQAESLEAVEKIVENDPFVISGARDVTIHEWEMETKYHFSE